MSEWLDADLGTVDFGLILTLNHARTLNPRPKSEMCPSDRGRDGGKTEKRLGHMNEWRLCSPI